MADPTATTELFTTLTREATLTSRVVQRLEAMIVANHLRPGDRLPTERELARQLGVSRTVVREAVSALTAKSLLEAAPGGGSHIRVPTAQSVTQTMTLFLRGEQPQIDYDRVHEVRCVLEVEIAALAAARRTEEDVLRLEALVTEMATLRDDGDRYVRNDVGFHSALAQATQNDLFVVLLNSVVDIMLEVRRRSLDVPGTFENALGHHRALFDRVQAGDIEGARQAMLSHLVDSRKIMQRFLEQQSAPQTGEKTP